MLVEGKLKESLLRPGTIWRRKKDGSWERVYLDSSTSRLIRGNKVGEVDFRTPFGLEHMPREKFLSSFEFLGWAEIRLSEITCDKNLIQSIGDPKLWKQR